MELCTVTVHNTVVHVVHFMQLKKPKILCTPTIVCVHCTLYNCNECFVHNFLPDNELFNNYYVIK